jgi:hypothetical protein
VRTAAERGQGQIDSAELMPLGASEDDSWRRRVRAYVSVGKCDDDKDARHSAGSTSSIVRNGYVDGSLLCPHCIQAQSCSRSYDKAEFELTRTRDEVEHWASTDTGSSHTDGHIARLIPGGPRHGDRCRQNVCLVRARSRHALNSYAPVLL